MSNDIKCSLSFLEVIIELRHLKSFVVLTQELHFGRAAKRLHIVQPALSKQMHLLEGEVGCRLLNRNRRGVALTEAGRLFLAEAEPGQPDGCKLKTLQPVRPRVAIH